MKAAAVERLMPAQQCTRKGEDLSQLRAKDSTSEIWPCSGQTMPFAGSITSCTDILRWHSGRMDSGVGTKGSTINVKRCEGRNRWTVSSTAEKGAIRTQVMPLMCRRAIRGGKRNSVRIHHFLRNWT